MTCVRSITPVEFNGYTVDFIYIVDDLDGNAFIREEENKLINKPGLGFTNGTKIDFGTNGCLVGVSVGIDKDDKIATLQFFYNDDLITEG